MGYPFGEKLGDSYRLFDVQEDRLHLRYIVELGNGRANTDTLVACEKTVLRESHLARKWATLMVTHLEVTLLRIRVA